MENYGYNPNGYNPHTVRTLDPVTEEIRFQAARNGHMAKNNYNYWTNGIKFSRPTKKENGYYKVLERIIKRPGLHKKDIIPNGGTTTIYRLIKGGLINKGSRKNGYIPTSLGQLYYMAMAKYI